MGSERPSLAGAVLGSAFGKGPIDLGVQQLQAVLEVVAIHHRHHRQASPRPLKIKASATCVFLFSVFFYSILFVCHFGISRRDDLALLEVPNWHFRIGRAAS